MRRIISQMMVTLDGYYSGPNGEINWHVVDEEHQLFSSQFLKSIDTILFGRTTYEMMENYWASDLGKVADPIVSNYMNSLNKIVISTALNTVNWNNTVLIKKNIKEEINKLKQASGKDIAILGSPTLATKLANEDLIDEYWIIVNPILLGKGKSIFHNIADKKEFHLIESKTFKSGNILHRYKPKCGRLEYNNVR